HVRRSLGLTALPPSPPLPQGGGCLAAERGTDLATYAARHLPLEGGGWEGVSESRDLRAGHASHIKPAAARPAGLLYLGIVWPERSAIFSPSLEHVNEPFTNQGTDLHQRPKTVAMLAAN